MIGYYDCPPHPLESLHPVYDAKWKKPGITREQIKAIFDEAVQSRRGQQRLGTCGGVRRRKSRKRYK